MLILQHDFYYKKVDEHIKAGTLFKENLNALCHENTLHALAGACENLIRNGIDLFGNGLYRKLLSEDDHFVTFVGIDARNIDHGHIHANISDHG
jgi:hypothetical protein